MTSHFRPDAVQAVTDSIESRPTPIQLGLGCWTGRRSPVIEAMELTELYSRPASEGERP